jgi:hypothetical protein
MGSKNNISKSNVWLSHYTLLKWWTMIGEDVSSARSLPQRSQFFEKQIRAIISGRANKKFDTSKTFLFVSKFLKIGVSLCEWYRYNKCLICFSNSKDLHDNHCSKHVQVFDQNSTQAQTLSRVDCLLCVFFELKFDCILNRDDPLKSFWDETSIFFSGSVIAIATL